jgi:hypothetical protein
MHMHIPAHTYALMPLWLAHVVLLLSDGQEELELWGQLLLGVQAVREVDAADAAVGVDLREDIR